MRRALALVVLTLVVALVAADPTLADGTPVLSLPGSAVVVDVENVTSGTATFSVSAVDGLGAPLPVSCDHSSGSSFPLGTTTVTCSATDPLSLITTSGSFDVVVRDTTFPVLGLPAVAPVDVDGTSSAAVTYSASATDAGSSVPVSCSPPSGSSFPLGTTHVSCSATDGAGNTSTGGFDVTVHDSTPPTLSLPGDITKSINGAASTVVTYSATASDGGTPLTPSCSPSSGSSFPLGTTTVSCSVTDAGGNTASGSFTVTVQDTTPPSVSITSGPSGTVNARDASIGFTASEGTTSCQIDGGGFSSCSSPASYSGLADGSHTFTVKAVDAASNSNTASLTWSIDATPPVINGPASAIDVEADGPSGGNATYSVSASDNGAPLLPSQLSCSPKSGSKFPLGETSVSCTARDAAGNVATSSFLVVVRDTTPPAINAPDVSVTATSAAGIKKTDPALASYLAHVTATDLVSTPTLTNNVSDVLPVGARGVTFTATDAAGNVATKRATITVLPVGRAAPPADLTPPANPTRVLARAGDHRIDLSWRVAADVSYVTVTVYAPGNGPGRVAYKGSAKAFSAKGLRNDVAYRFVLVAWDKAGNRSKGVVVRATPHAELLASPKQNERISAPPLLRWAPVGEADYFNVQLWRGKQKVLSAWPAVAHFQLTARWLYDGKSQTLSPGTYTWYVWPGIGPRSAAHYGELLGSRTFVVVKKGPAV
jgi:hypothetical protein